MRLKLLLALFTFCTGVLVFVSAAYAQQDAEALEKAVQQLQAASPPPLAKAYEMNLPLALLAAKKLRLLETGQPLLGRDEITRQILDEGRSALQRARGGQLPTLVPGTLGELAYITENDGTVQPYYLYVPENYTPARKWPLIVFLHGYVPSITVLEPWLPSPQQCSLAGKYGCMLLIPYGRRNTDFQGIGETDVFAALEAVQRHFPVDHERLYLTGVSMGGMGAWNIALRHPGVFAAVTPMCGQTDMFRWWGWSREAMPPWKRWLVEWDNALDQVPNLRGQNVFVQHGAADTLIPVEQTKLMVTAAEQAGTPVKVHYFPDESHFIYFNDESYANAWSWVRQFTLQPNPRRVDFKCYSLAYNKAFWLKIVELSEWGKPGQVSAEVAADGKSVKITATNIAQLEIDTRQAGLTGQQLNYTWNGRTKSTPIKDGLARLWPQPIDPMGLSSIPPLMKRHGLCGPCEDVFNTRFLVVQGSGGNEEQKTQLATQIAKWCKEWDAFGDGLPAVKLDTAVTSQDIANCNLVLFGTPETNSILARIADRLPIKIADHCYAIDGKTYQGSDLGLVMCYPNPLNIGRYVLIYSGERYGEKCSINHKHDMLPDFTIFTTRSFGQDDVNDALCAGFFDMHWAVDRTLYWTQELPRL